MRKRGNTVVCLCVCLSTVLQLLNDQFLVNVAWSWLCGANTVRSNAAQSSLVHFDKSTTTLPNRLTTCGSNLAPLESIDEVQVRASI